MQLHDTPDFKRWLAERKTRFEQVHGTPDPDRTTCDTCGIRTSRSQLLDDTTCLECLAAEYGEQRFAVRLGGTLTNVVAAFASADPQEAGKLIEHLDDRLRDAINDYMAERAGL